MAAAVAGWSQLGPAMPHTDSRAVQAIAIRMPACQPTNQPTLSHPRNGDAQPGGLLVNQLTALSTLPPTIVTVAVETLNLEVVGQDELERALDRCSGFVLGSPTLGGHMPTQVQTALGTIMRNTNARQVPCSVFGSFGWSGEAVDMMERRLKVGAWGGWWWW